MNRYLIVATVADRLPMLRLLVESVVRYLPEWTLIVVAQEYSDADVATFETYRPEGSGFVALPARVGPHNAKLFALDFIKAIEPADDYVVCSADDDMEFTAATDLEPCVEAAMRPGIGLVSAGWVKHANGVAGKVLVNEFIEQPIVYTGGGLVFSGATAKIIHAIPEGAYFCDNSEWSLAVYLTGRKNYRFRGSLTIHRICSKGGRRAWVVGSAKAIPDARYLAMKPGNKPGPNNWIVGQSKDLTPRARMAHKLARMAGLGEFNLKTEVEA